MVRHSTAVKNSLASCPVFLQAAVSTQDSAFEQVLGCWQDSKPGDTSPGATGHRVLPYSVCPGGAKGQAAAGQCKTPDCKYEGRAAPACEAAKITPEYCAQQCLDWVATPPPSAAYTIWSGVEWTQECWCGDWHTQMTILSYDSFINSALPNSASCARML